MASAQEVKEYFAYWLQLGKKVWVGNGQKALQPQSIIKGDRYSQEFEEFWQYLLSAESGDCYLEGTEESLAQLLCEEWETVSCARCEMPVPVLSLGIQSAVCPCNDLSNWPNLELPAPRSPVDSQSRLQQISDRASKVAKSE